MWNQLKYLWINKSDNKKTDKTIVFLQLKQLSVEIGILC